MLDRNDPERLELGVEHPSKVDVRPRARSIDDGFPERRARCEFKGDVLAHLEAAALDEGPDGRDQRRRPAAVAYGANPHLDGAQHGAPPPAVHGRDGAGARVGEQHRGAVGHTRTAGDAWRRGDGDVAVDVS